MQIKTFRALNMRDALHAIKLELGPEAVILSTKEIKTGSQLFGIFSRTVVEVVAAVDPVSPRPHRRSTLDSSAQNNRGLSQPARMRDELDDTAAILSYGTLRDHQPIADIDRPFSDYMQRAVPLHPRNDLPQIPEPTKNLHEAFETAYLRGSGKSLEVEMRGIRRLVGTLVKNDRDVFVEHLSEPLRAAYDRLLDCGLEPEAIMPIVQALEDNLPPDEAAFPVGLHDAVYRCLCRDLKYAGILAQQTTRPKVMMVVGPSGVGKTTTIAKLAAHYALQQKRKVALITLDTYRVAAVEQLRAYGNILGLGVDVALTCQDLQGLLHRRRAADLILVDTAGRSHLDHAALQELQKLTRLSGCIETHLVLSAASRETDSERIVARFAPLPVARIIFSKLDETSQYGGIVNVLRRSGLALSYLSAGQRVPEDLLMATPKLLADLLLDGLTAMKTATKPEVLSCLEDSEQERGQPRPGSRGIRWPEEGGAGKTVFPKTLAAGGNQGI
jgi:flagellar biosynthesis protein FlhF